MLSVRIDGRAVDEALQRLDASLKGRVLGEALLAGALTAEGIAKTKAPVDTGFLRNSIQSKSVSDTEARVTVGAEYGVHVEWGTRRMAAKPFIRPTVDGHGQEIVDVVLQHIRNRAGL